MSPRFVGSCFLLAERRRTLLSRSAGSSTTRTPPTRHWTSLGRGVATGPRFPSFTGSRDLRQQKKRSLTSTPVTDSIPSGRVPPTIPRPSRYPDSFVGHGTRSPGTDRSGTTDRRASGGRVPERQVTVHSAFETYVRRF